MHKGFLKAGAGIAVLGVILGAFAAHGIRGKVGDHVLTTFETAVRYQFYHAFALILTGIIFREFPHALSKWAGRFFIAGIILFSGSLYFLSYLQAAVSPDHKWVGAATPFGGTCFIIGWICLFITFFKKPTAACTL